MCLYVVLSHENKTHPSKYNKKNCDYVPSEVIHVLREASGDNPVAQDHQSLFENGIVEVLSTTIWVANHCLLFHGSGLCVSDNQFSFNSLDFSHDQDLIRSNEINITPHTSSELSPIYVLILDIQIGSNPTSFSVCTTPANIRIIMKMILIFLILMGCKLASMRTHGVSTHESVMCLNHDSVIMMSLNGVERAKPNYGLIIVQNIVIKTRVCILDVEIKQMMSHQVVIRTLITDCPEQYTNHQINLMECDIIILEVNESDFYSKLLIETSSLTNRTSFTIDHHRYISF